MTEAQAYDLLGWPHEGKGFILPLTGRPNDDYVAHRCKCGMAGVSIRESLPPVPLCVRCNRQLEFVGSREIPVTPGKNFQQFTFTK